MRLLDVSVNKPWNGVPYRRWSKEEIVDLLTSLRGAKKCPEIKNLSVIAATQLEEHRVLQLVTKNWFSYLKKSRRVHWCR